MLRIKMEINMMSPFLRVLSGVIHVEDVGEVLSNAAIELFRCKFTKDQHTLGYEAFESEVDKIPTALFSCIKPILDAKIRSLFVGMCLENEDYVWVMLDGDDSWTQVVDADKEAERFIERKKQDETFSTLIACNSGH